MPTCCLDVALRERGAAHDTDCIENAARQMLLAVLHCRLQCIDRQRQQPLAGVLNGFLTQRYGIVGKLLEKVSQRRIRSVGHA